MTIYNKQRKLFTDRAGDAAGFLQGMLDWPNVHIDIAFDRYGGIRVQRIWSPDGKEGLGWKRTDKDLFSLALILAIEEFLLTDGAQEAKDLIVYLLRLIDNFKQEL